MTSSKSIFIHLAVKKYCVKLNQNEKLKGIHVSHLTFFYFYAKTRLLINWLIWNYHSVDSYMYSEPQFNLISLFLFSRYRNFPKVKSAFIPTSIQRKHMCNYMGTIYVNSSRQVLLDLLSTPEMKDRCYVKVRHK